MSGKGVSVFDYRALAKARLPHFLFEYIDGGSYDEVTLARNVADLRAIALRQRVLRDVSVIDPSTELFGRTWTLPVGLGPVGLAGLYARRGEVQAARAAAAAGVPFCLSALSICALEEVSKAADGLWCQLYFVKDRRFAEGLIDRAKALGCGALVLTVDVAVPGSRYRDSRAAGGVARRLAQLLVRPHWLWDVGVRGKPHTLGNLAEIVGQKAPLQDFQRWIGKNLDASVNWSDVEWIRKRWGGPFVIKGILDPQDAKLAVASGADAIVVSNHGGRQLDGVLSSAAALPRCVEAVAGNARVFADGGVRSGLDVARMLALGADFVLLGRAWAYALAAGGGGEVENMLGLIDGELRSAMALMGVSRTGEITRANVDLV